MKQGQGRRKGNAAFPLEYENEQVGVLEGKNMTMDA